MSTEAVNWATSQPVTRSAAKFILVILAHHVKSGASDPIAWPSVKSMCDSTAQDRKTVLANLRRLIDDGFIEDTGERVGRTGQVIVYRLRANRSDLVSNSTENGPVECKETVPKTELLQGVLPVPKTVLLENQRVPFPTSNSTVFDIKQYRFSVETVPKKGHGTIKEQQKEQQKELPSDLADASASPDRIPCPVKEIVALYEKAMPMNPRVKVLNDARRKAIAARWKEAARLDCKPFGYVDIDSGLAAWARFFEICARSRFLTGQVEPQQGRNPFLADIDWLMKPSNFAKCLENKYHRETA